MKRARTSVRALSLALSLVALPRAADAAPTAARFGAEGQLSIGVERLYGVTRSSEEHGQTYTTVSLLGGAGGDAYVNPYAVPRLGVDYFALDGLSLGLAAHYARITRKGDDGSVRVIGVAPRVGYALALGEHLAFWPRVGVTYADYAESFGVSDIIETHQLFAVSAEAQLVATLAPHVAFTFAPTLDDCFSAGGSKLDSLGVFGGLLGSF